MEKLKMHSPDQTVENVERIRELFPSCVTEAKDDSGKVRWVVDFDQLRQSLSEHLVEGAQERFRMDWPGKNEALITANLPVAKSLRPSEDESEDFHSTKNLFIEGDNLDVLKLLQETYLGSVRLIYIDPPYNTGNDFIYDDDTVEDSDEYLLRSNQADYDGNRLLGNVESNGRFHSDWLSMIYPRLKLARNLLRQDGVIFISIGDNEQANLKKVCDEVFGADNFLGCACRVSKKANNQGDYWSPNYDYILTYARNKDKCPVFFGGVNYDAYDQIEVEGPRKGERYQLVRLYMTSLDPMRGCTNQRYFIEAPDGTLLIPPGNIFPEAFSDGAKIPPQTGEDKVWRWSADSYAKRRDEIVVRKVRSSNLVDHKGGSVKWNVFTKTYLNDVIEKSSAKPNSLIEDHINQNSSKELGELGIPFSFAKPSSLIQYLCEIARLEKDDIVMDFFAGSGSAGHGVMRFNETHKQSLRYILVQLPEALDYEDRNQQAGYIFCDKLGLEKTIPSITKERLRRAGAELRNSGWTGDAGFRVLKLDTSNMADIFYDPLATMQGNLLEAVENIKPDRVDPLDLLFQVLLDWGMDLTLPIRSEKLDGKTVFFVSTEPYDLVACFDSGLSEDFVKKLAIYKPLRVVFRDNGFMSDAVKINVDQIFAQLSPTTEVKSI